MRSLLPLLFIGCGAASTPQGLQGTAATRSCAAHAAAIAHRVTREAPHRALVHITLATCLVEPGHVRLQGTAEVRWAEHRRTFPIGDEREDPASTAPALLETIYSALSEDIAKAALSRVQETR